MNNIDGSINSRAGAVSEAVPTLQECDKFFLRRISGRILLALGLIFAMEVASYLVQISHVKREARTFVMVSVSSEQRILSQRLTLQLQLLEKTKALSSREKAKTLIASEIERMRKNHEQLILGDSERGIPAQKSLAIHSIFFGEPTLLDRKVKEYLALTKLLLSNKNPNSRIKLLERLSELSGILIKDFDQLSAQYRKEGTDGMRGLQRLLNHIMLAQVILLLFSAIFIFYPLVLRLRKELQERRLARADLIEQNKYLEHFASVIAHDLKAPLNNIGGFCQLLNSRLAKNRESDPEINQTLNLTSSGVTRMSQMIDEMLRYSRLSSQDRVLEKVSLKQVAEKVLADFSCKISAESAEIIIKDLPAILCDRVLIEHLFMNLISNALKYRDPQRSPRILIQEYEIAGKGSHISFMIEDNGRGFPAGTEKWMFEPFRRLNQDDSVEGSGFGLAFCKKIVLRHNGNIFAEHVQGGGARFVVSLGNPQ